MLGIILSLGACNSKGAEYYIDKYDVTVKLNVDESIDVVCDMEVLFFYNESGNLIGMVDIGLYEDMTADEVLAKLSNVSLDAVEVQDIAKKVAFIEATDATYGIHCFSYYDEKTDVSLYGRFFDFVDSDTVKEIAKSLSAKK